MKPRLFRSVPALALAGALVLSGLAIADDTKLSQPPAPLSSAERKAAAQQGTQFGNETHDSAEQETVQAEEGTGAKGAGRTRVNGKWVDNEELMGRGYDQGRVDRAGQVDGANDMEELRRLHTEEQARTTTDDGVAGAAFRTVEEAGAKQAQGRREIARTNWAVTNGAIAGARQGEILGQRFDQCTTTTTVIPGTSPDAHLIEQHVCEQVVTPDGAGGVICTRERVVSTTQPMETQTLEQWLSVNGGQSQTYCTRDTGLEPYQEDVPGEKTGVLDMTTEQPGLLCTRQRWVTLVNTPQDKEKVATLAINTEIGGLSCSRRIEPTAGSSTQPQTKSATLPVDNQSGGNLCKRVVWPSASSTPSSGTKTAMLTVNTDAGGLSCTRTVWPTSTTTSTPSSHDALLVIDTQSAGNVCKRRVWPTGGSTSVAGGKAVTVGVNTEVGGASCTRTVWPTSGTGTTPVSHDAALAVDLQAGSNLCTREVWPANGSSTVPGTKSGVLGINTEVGGVSCTRQIWPTSGTGSTPLTQDALLVIDTQSDGNACKRRVWPTNATNTVAGGKNVNIGVNTESGGVSCTRTVWPTAGTSTTAVSHDATIAVDTQSGGNLCKREVWPSGGTSSVAGTKTVSVGINTEVGGASCTRTVWPTSGSGTTAVSHDVTLPIDLQAPGNLCTREVWPTNSSGTVAGSKSATLGVSTELGGLSCTRIIQPGSSSSTTAGNKAVVASVNNESGGNSCRRWRNVTAGVGSPVTSSIYTYQRPTRFNGATAPWTTITDLSGLIPPGTTALQNFSFVVDTQNTKTIEFVLTDPPTLANGWKATIRTDGACEFTPDPDPNCEIADNDSLKKSLLELAGVRTAQAAPCGTWDCGTSTNTGHFVFTPVLSTRTWSTLESGNCADTGTTNCPTAWSCTTQAPTTINGIAVSAAEVSALAGLYPSAPGACTDSTLARTCGGTSTTSNSFSIADALAAGTTSISGFQATIQNSQPGVTRTVTQVPSAANSWVAIVRIDRSDYSYTPAPVQLNLTWNQTATSTTASVVDSGNCADTGSTNCPTQWFCDGTAPRVVGGLTVTTAMANQFAPLYPGAPATCAAASLNRMCSGSSTQSTSVSIADQIPGGTTAISGFAFTVSNPQAGVTVSLTQTPSLANSWVAIYSVLRTNWASAPASPNVNMTWDATVAGTTVSTRDTGNCSASGSANCPASWSCTTSAPTVINGITVTTAMAGQVAPLFPGAASTCARGSLGKTCSGTATTTTTVDLSGRMPAGTTSISGLTFTVLNPQAGVTVTMTQTPTSANGWVAGFSIARSTWASQPAAPDIRITWNASSPSTTLSVVDSGNCSDAGSANCPTSWACTGPAPRVVNGTIVTAAMAATQAPLFPGAANNCVIGTLSRTCSGSSATSTSVSIAADLPAGTTAISGFSFTVNNPQSGVSVALTQTPSLANSWVAIFSVTRSNWATAPAQPSLTLNWTASTPTTNVSTQDTGNCSASGSSHCPATWSCQTLAPTVINGITVTTAMANQVAPLFTGAASTCARGSLDKVCGGTASVTSNVDLSSRMPAGTTSISGLAFTVLNPQAGVTVTMTQTPSSANGWVAVFRADRTSWGTVPASPQLRITWNASSPSTSVSVVDSGNCGDAGSASCPTSWSCTNAAPHVVNGITVTSAMAATQAPLFPSASSSCVVGTLARVCGGGAGTSTSVSIAADLPAGTTAISGFGFTVTNPQAGVTVALTQTPSLANSWVAVFSVTRTGWGSVPAQPNLNLTWNASVPVVNVSTNDTGNCSSAGTANCPTVWSCETSAPTTINGITVTPAMAGQVAPLFPGAANTCAIGSLDRVCAGTSTRNTNVDLSARMPAGTTAITGFGFTVLNPQTGVTVTLTQTPSLANSWIARFRVDRTVWSSQPAQPNIRISWNATTPTTTLTVQDTGDCADPGSASCPTSWACSASAPTTVNGIVVDASMAASQAPLFPGAANSCVRGQLSRTCSGSVATTTALSIADQIPAGTTAIANFAFTVSNPQSGVTVDLLQAPTAGNSWVATFSVARTNWATAPAQPAITMTWDATVPSVSLTTRDTGNCAATGSANCPATWSCQTSAPTTINGITVTAAMAGQVAPLFPGAASTCARGSLNAVCGGTASVTSTVNLASRMPAGTTAISDLDFTVLNPQSGITVTKTVDPTLANGWVATFRVDRTSWASTPVQPNIRITWNATTPTTSVTVVDSGNCADTGSANCPTSWNCTTSAPHVVNGITVTSAMAATQAPLFPSASSSCVVGTLARTCSGSSATSTSVSIAADLPAGTSAITGFAFTVANPQSGVTVALTQTPSQANSWVAIFSVTRTNWATTPVDPQLNLTWNATVPSVTVGTNDTGNCSAAGSANCPTSWTCETHAPTTINGITVTPAMAAQVAPLFTGAANTCAIGSLDKVCSGTSSRNTAVDLSSRIPAGTTTISSFAFSVTNPQAGVTVTLTQTPSLANSWVARFRVDRTVWTSQPAQPNVHITWNSNVPGTNVTVQDTGDCSDPGSTQCPTQWSCKNSAPHTVNGISVTAAMAATQAPLFPGAASSCVVGELDRVCSGSTTVGNTISIADQVPAGVTAISNFGFTVQNPQAGVAVSLVTAPTLANGWTATFNVTRTSLNPPAQPQITMTWDMAVPGTNVTVQETGDCAQTGTAQCPAVWSCARSAPTTTNGISVTSAMTAQVAPLFPGAANTCAEGSLDKACSGSAATQTSVSIAADLPAGTTAIENFTFNVTNPQSGVSVALTQTPSQANSWVAIFRVTRTDFSAPKNDPTITMAWNAVVPTVTLTVVETGNCNDPGSVSCPTQWQCSSSAPTSVNGISITPAMAATKAPLFPGAASECVKGDLNRVCSGSGVVGTTVSVADLVPAGVTAIQNFNFTVLNPQPGVSVTLVSPPTLANGWVASFNVARSDWSQVPAAPEVRVAFQVLVSEPQFSLQETGNCNDTGSQACPAQWSCTSNAPTTINGIAVSVAMVSPLPALFPNAAASCVAGDLNKVCSGESSVQSSISIADQLPAGTTAINNFSFTWNNQHPSLTVTLISPPTAGNSWSATFQVTRNYSGGATPPAPQLTLRWTVSETRYRAVTTDTGDCTPPDDDDGGGAGPGDPGPGGPGPGGPGDPNDPNDPNDPPVQQTSVSRSSDTWLASLRRAIVPDAAAKSASGANAAVQVIQEPGVPDPGYPGEPGDPGEPGGPLPPGDSCAREWVCTAELPQTIGGIAITPEMLAERGPLFPGDGPPPTCVTAEYRSVCGGEGGVSNSISIAHLLLPNTQQIYNYTWTLTDPGQAVSVSSVQTPALTNNWVAIFEVRRTNWNIAPQAPRVKLQWDQGGEYEHEFEIVDTGDCDAGGEGDEFCRVEWTCDEEAPPGPDPDGAVLLNHAQLTKRGAHAIWGEPMDSEVDLSEGITAGTTEIRNFRYSVSATNGCQVHVIGQLSLANPTVSTVTTATQQGTSCWPYITFDWDNYGPPQQASLNPTQQFLSSLATARNELLPAALAAVCVDCPGGGDGGVVDTGDLIDEPPLFPGDGPPPTCMRATKRVDCDGVYTGEECFLNSEGVEVCVEQPPTETPPNTCEEYEDDPQCALIREECAEDGMSSSGWCYVKSRLYECRRTVPGGATDPVIREETVCAEGDPGTTLPAVCQDGTCTSDEPEVETTSMSKAGAKMMILQTIMNDYEGPATGGPPGGGGTDPCVSNCGPTNPQSVGAAETSLRDSLMTMAGVSTAQAQSGGPEVPPPDTNPPGTGLPGGTLPPGTLPSGLPDPFAIPPWPQGEEDDPNYGGFEGSYSMPTVKFFPGKKRDCMKALGGLLNCCKKTPPQDQAPALWDAIKKNLARANNARGQEDTEDDGNAFMELMQGAGHLDLQKLLVSARNGLLGGGEGTDEDTDASMGDAYKQFFQYETQVVKPKLSWYCDNDEFELAVGKQTGTCTHLGSFCQTRVLGVCIIKKDRYCCFNSPITRILREHMDEVGISDLGTAKRPRCEGVTVEQMSRLNPDDVDTGEVEGRMAQGRFNIDIGTLMGMDFPQMQALLDGANSVLGDPTRMNPSDRNQEWLNESDNNGSFGSIMNSQAGYQPTEPAETEATPGTVGLTWIEREVARGTATRIGIRRTGSKGAVRVRVWTEAGTAQETRDFLPIDSFVQWSDGEYGEKPVLLKAHLLPDGVTTPKVTYTLRIEIVSGDATLSGNTQATIHIKED